MQNPLTRVLMSLAISAAVCSWSLAPNARAVEADSSSDLSTATNLKNIFADTNIPISIKMKQMDKSWRRFINIKPVMDRQTEVWAAAAGVELGVHFTAGQTVTMGESTFLVAYHLPVNIDRRFLNWHGHGEAPRARKPDTETVLNLSLLNLTSMNGMTDVRPFDPNSDMESVTQINGASVRTLTTLGTGMMRFIRARGQFPFLSNPIDWDAKRAFYPYVGDERLFMHPSTQQMYLWNTTMNGKKAVHFKDKKNMVLFYEAENSGDGTRGVLFMDGSVERLNADKWKRVKKVSKIWEQGDPTGEIRAVGGARIQRTFNAAANVMTN